MVLKVAGRETCGTQLLASELGQGTHPELQSAVFYFDIINGNARPTISLPVVNACHRQRTVAQCFATAGATTRKYVQTR